MNVDDGIHLFSAQDYLHPAGILRIVRGCSCGPCKPVSSAMMPTVGSKRIERPVLVAGTERSCQSRLDLAYSINVKNSIFIPSIKRLSMFWLRRTSFLHLPSATGYLKTDS